MKEALFSIKHFSRVLGFLVLDLLAVGQFQSARAQDWKQITAPISSTDRTELESYFLNVNVGFTFYPGIRDNPPVCFVGDEGSAKLARTTTAD